MQLRILRLAARTHMQGSLLQARGRLDEASMAYRRTVEILPSAFYAWHDLAQVELQRGRFDEAASAYRGLLRAYPFKYTAALYREVGFVELRANRLELAHQDLLQAVALDPNDWLAQYYLGHVYRRLRNLTAARAAWQRTLTLRPGFEPARDQLLRIDAPLP